MRTVCVFFSLIIGASSFALPNPSRTNSITSLMALIPEDEMSPDQLEIEKIRKQWNEIRHYSREEAESKLEGDLLEAYNRYYKKYDEDMELMMQITEKLDKVLNPPKVPKKGKKQRKRDAYARKMSRSMKPLTI